MAVLFNNYYLWGASLFILLSGCTQQPTPTFASDIAPIIHANCATCHSPNGGGPFSLIRYEDVAKRSKMIAHVTHIRYMPPWPAAANYGEFKGEKRLTESEIKLIQRWHKTGSKPGDTSLLDYTIVQNRPKYARKPDLVIPVQPIKIKGNHRDRFYVTKTPLDLPSDTFVRMLEFVPGIPSLVHHVNGHVLNYAADYPININEGLTIIDVEDPDFDVAFQQMNLYDPSKSLPDRIHSAVNYLPGLHGVFYPDGIGGFGLNKKSVIVFKDLHYGPSDKDTIDQSYLHFYFTDKAPERPMLETMLGTNGISKIEPPLVVPANVVKSFITKAFIPEPISILSVNPHMHLLGSSFKAYALKPNGDTIQLIHIPRWDFKWQYSYTYKHMVKIPKGSTIQVEATFDNTSKNPNNPHTPPQTISERHTLGGASMRVTDEMLQFIISYLPYKPGDELISLETNAQ